jgi:L-lysine 2,3-aminomutase
VELFSRVLPFRVNEYVLSELIGWDRVPDDPMFQLVFPQPGMLTTDDEDLLATTHGGSAERQVVESIRQRLNPHPAGQVELNVPSDASGNIPGVQHKYRETVLYFPAAGQTCHAYCTYCFRWAQFVGDARTRFAAADPGRLVAYLNHHPGVSDVLVTGGDPLIMSVDRLKSHILPLLAVETIRTIRIGTKSLAYWPRRFVTDADADETLRLFEKVVSAGKTLAVMAHFSHASELATSLSRLAVERVRATGAVIYCQAPVIAKVNNTSDAWLRLWTEQIKVGAVPYYLFVPRDTGPRDYFKVSLADAVDIFAGAYRALPGLARTVRGPVMSTTAGKIVTDGVEEIDGSKYFRLRFLQARDPSIVGRPFRAALDTNASWIDDLRLDTSVPADISAALGRGRSTG